MFSKIRRLGWIAIVAISACALPTADEADVGVTVQAICPGFNPMSPDPEFCGNGCTCGVGQGDCDSDADCDPNLICRKNVGANYGLPPDYDVCEPITDCKRFLKPKSLTHCSDACPCGEGEGGCTVGNDATCDDGLTCFADRGPSVGLSTSYDICFAACPPFDPTKPNTSFCTPQCPCGLGEGDCDYNSQCAAGVCVQDNGANYGLPADWDACECPAFNSASPNPAFCGTPGCPCGQGEGNCTSDAQCQTGLSCIANAGSGYGLPASYGVCDVPGTCPVFNVNKPSHTFCTTQCPCADGEGGCSLDTQCEMGLTCLQDRGPAIGLPTSYDLCMAACPAFDSAFPNTQFCTPQCPCGLGEGDCDYDAHCTAGICVQDNGADYGLPADWDACACPTFNVSAPRQNFCSIIGCGTCGAGEGDCDSDLECDASLLCLRLGSQYGLPSFYDVCTPPLLTALTSSVGTLSPALAGGTFAYTIPVPLGAQHVTLTPTASTGATLTIDGIAHVSGQPWVSPLLDLGANVVSIDVTQSGITASYTITVMRGALPDAYIKASNTNAGDRFGASVALDGDTLVVGAHREASNATGVDGDQANNSAGSAGAAYVFVRNGGVWAQQAYLKASNSELGDQFGLYVAISGNTIVVGAAQEDSAATTVDGDGADNTAANSGAAYVYVRSGSTWTQQAYLKASNAQAGDNFGWSVGVSGDVVLVGARGEDSVATGINGDQSLNTNAGLNSGAVYAFVRSGSTWTQEAYIKPNNTGRQDRFGWTVDIDGDTAVVGADRESSNATGIDGDGANDNAVDSGAAYVFTRSAGTWTQQAYIKASNSEAADHFGYSVALDGDTLVVGSYQEDSASSTEGDNSAASAGAAYVFTRSGGVWSQAAYLKASNAEAQDLFGTVVAVGDGYVLVGAPGEDSAATGVDGDETSNAADGAGAAYLFVDVGGTWMQAAYLKASNTGNGYAYGQGVAVSSTLWVVSSYLEDSAATGINGNQADTSADLAGAVYTYR